MSKPRIVIIAGPSSSGKTSLIERLSLRYPHLVSVLCVDNYYFKQDHIPIHERYDVNYDHPNSLEWPLLQRHLESLLENKTVQGPRYCFVTQTRIAPPVIINPKPLIVIDGILTLGQKDIMSLAEDAIYLDTPLDICLARLIERNLSERGRTLEQILDQYLHQTRPMFFEFVAPSKQYATHIIPYRDNIDESYSLLEKFLEPYLKPQTVVA